MGIKWVLTNHIIASVLSLSFIFYLDKPIVLLFYVGWLVYLTNEIKITLKANFGMHAMILASVLFIGTMPLNGGLVSQSSFDVNVTIAGSGVSLIIYLSVLYWINKIKTKGAAK